MNYYRESSMLPKTILVPTDLSDNEVRHAGLAAGWVDVKVCATGPTLAGFDLTIQPNGLTDVASVAAHSAPCSGS